MQISSLHRGLLLVCAALSAALVARALLAPPLPRAPTTEPAGALLALPGNAAVVVTLDLVRLVESELGAALVSPWLEASRRDLRQRCGGNPTAEVREIAFAIPTRAHGGDLEFGIAAIGALSADAVSDCAAALLESRGRIPARRTVHSFSTVRDREKPDAGEIAVRRGGPALLSGGSYLREMIDAVEGRIPAAATDPLHRELRAALGSDAVLRASGAWPAGQAGLAAGVAGVPASELDHLQAAAVGAWVDARLRLELLLICDTAPNCQRLAKTAEERLREVSGPLLRWWLGFDPSARVSVTSIGRRLSLRVTLARDEAERLLGLAQRTWSLGGADGPAQQP